MIRIISLILLSLFAHTANAKDPIYTGFFSDVAVSGYDTVAYFTQNKPVKGSKAIATEYMDATWLFSTEANRQLFLTNPEQYAPQFGGYCAYAVAKNSTASSDPEAWKIVDGKLYLNYSHKIQKTWESDQANYIEKAHKAWPSVLE